MPTGIFYVRKGSSGSRNGTRTKAKDKQAPGGNQPRATQVAAENAARRRDQFAELLAEGVPLDDAATAVDSSPSTGREMLRRIREGLGILGEPACAGDFVHPVKGK